MSDSTSISSAVSRQHRQPRRRQGIYWICTIPKNDWTPDLPEGIAWIRGQLERGANSDYEHWQVCLSAKKKCSLTSLLSVSALPTTGHYELTRSRAAKDYVWKEDTRVGEQFEFGSMAFERNSVVDWDSIREDARKNDLSNCPSDIYVRYYNQLSRIGADHTQPVSMVRTCSVFWGRTGTGKSRTAWERAGLQAYSKDPRTKFWCGYQGQKIIVIDEFRGGIDIAHLLRWLDRYPVRVERKGGSYPLMAEQYFITSNLHPNDWYPDLDTETKNALLRRIEITHFDSLT